MGAPVGNKYALGNSGGRPAMYDSAEELAAAVIDYFDYCVQAQVKSTITGLCLYIGFSSRSTLDDYAVKSDEFAYIVKRGKLAVENSYELSGQTIDIFALKNMGWKDKSEMGFTDNEGNDVSPVQVFQLPDNNRNQQPENG